MSPKFSYLFFAGGAVVIWAVARMAGVSPVIGYAVLALAAAADLLIRRHRRQVPAEGK